MTYTDVKVWVDQRKWMWKVRYKEVLGIIKYLYHTPGRIFYSQFHKAVVASRMDWYTERRAKGQALDRVAKLEAIIKLNHPEDFKWKEEVARLQEQVKKLKREDTIKRESLERKNRELDAMHYVWCDGGCGGGVHRYHDAPLDEEIVKLAVNNTNRLIRWYNNSEFRHLDNIDPDGVKNRFVYIYAMNAIKDAIKVSEKSGPEAAWRHVEDCIKNRQIRA